MTKKGYYYEKDEVYFDTPKMLEKCLNSNPQH